MSESSVKVAGRTWDDQGSITLSPCGYPEFPHIKAGYILRIEDTFWVTRIAAKWLQQGSQAEIMDSLQLASVVLECCFESFPLVKVVEGPLPLKKRPLGWVKRSPQEESCWRRCSFVSTHHSAVVSSVCDPSALSVFQSEQEKSWLWLYDGWYSLESRCNFMKASHHH